MSAQNPREQFAVIGCLFGTAYLLSLYLPPGLPDFLTGLILGLGLIAITLDLLPERALERLRKWKRRE